MRRLYHDVTGVGAVGRRRLQSVNPVTALKRRHPRSHGRDGARKIIAENQRKLGRASTATSISFGAGFCRGTCRTSRAPLPAGPRQTNAALVVMSHLSPLPFAARFGSGQRAGVIWSRLKFFKS